MELFSLNRIEFNLIILIFGILLSLSIIQAKINYENKDDHYYKQSIYQNHKISSTGSTFPRRSHHSTQNTLRKQINATFPLKLHKIPNKPIHQNNFKTDSTITDKRNPEAQSNTSVENNNGLKYQYHYNNGKIPRHKFRNQHPNLIDNNFSPKNARPSTTNKDGILKDVEHIGHSNIGYVNTWNDPRLPETPAEFPTKDDDGRHICAQHKTVQVQVKSTEIYSRPIYRHISEPCHINKICTRVQLFHEPAYRDVVRSKPTKQIVYDCCNGWEKNSKTDADCSKPICKVKCKNDGTCVKPDVCNCQQGFTGRFCERDINECKENKPCDQLCYNTEGSYYCKCREGFYLLSDKQSCKKIGGTDDAFEARDLENEIDRGDIETNNVNNELKSRLHQIEKILANERATTHELQKHLQATYQNVDSLKTRLNSLEQKQQDISHLQTSLLDYENKTKKLEYLINVLFKCRTNPNQSFCV